MFVQIFVKGQTICEHATQEYWLSFWKEKDKMKMCSVCSGERVCWMTGLFYASVINYVDVNSHYCAENPLFLDVHTQTSNGCI